MSRSYKHTPVITDRSGCPHTAKYFKRQANRKVRHTFNVPNGKQYRRVYNPWNIRDYICRESKSDAAAWYRKITSQNYPYLYYRDRILSQCPTLEDYLNKYWAHDFYRK